MSAYMIWDTTKYYNIASYISSPPDLANWANPSCLHTTLASLKFHSARRLQIVFHCPSWHTSTSPSNLFCPPVNWIAFSPQSIASCQPGIQLLALNNFQIRGWSSEGGCRSAGMGWLATPSPFHLRIFSTWWLRVIISSSQPTRLSIS